MERAKRLILTMTLSLATAEQPRKVCVVVASRANYGRIKTVLQAIRENPKLKLQLIVSASALLYRFGSTIDHIRADGFEPDECVYIIVEGENPTTMAKSTGLAIMELATAFGKLQPDIVLTVADRFETISTAIAASYMNIVVAHTQGGEVTGNIDESVRHAVTKLSHVHFPATEQSHERLVKMGEAAAEVHLTGCPSIDIARLALDRALPEDFFGMAIRKHTKGSGAGLDPTKAYIVVSQHPVTSEFGDGYLQIHETLKAVHALGIQAVWFWPNVDAGSDHVSKGLRLFREDHPSAPVAFVRSLPPDEYALLMRHSACIVGNSSSGLREAAFFGLPSVNIGSRQQGRERAANVMDVGYNADDILAALRAQLKVGRYTPSHLFGDGYAGQRIADCLAVCNPAIQKRLQY